MSIELDQTVISRGTYTVADAAREYLEELRRAQRDSTIAPARWNLERSGVLCGVFGRIELSKLRAADVKRMRDALLARDERGRQMGKSGANRVMTTVKACLSLAVENERVPASALYVWRRVKQFPKADRRREVYLDLTQRRALLDAARGSIRELLEAALLTGARPGELASLTRGAFDGRTRTLELSGKTGSREVPLHPAALALFERLAQSRPSGALLLTQDSGKRWARIAWSRAIRAAVQAALANGTPMPDGVTLYACRHTFITQALMDGLTPADVANVTGTSLVMLQRHYSQFVHGVVRERLAAVQML